MLKMARVPESCQRWSRGVAVAHEGAQVFYLRKTLRARRTEGVEDPCGVEEPQYVGGIDEENALVPTAPELEAKPVERTRP